MTKHTLDDFLDWTNRGWWGKLPRSGVVRERIDRLNPPRKQACFANGGSLDPVGETVERSPRARESRVAVSWIPKRAGVATGPQRARTDAAISSLSFPPRDESRLPSKRKRKREREKRRKRIKPSLGTLALRKLLWFRLLDPLWAHISIDRSRREKSPFSRHGRDLSDAVFFGCLHRAYKRTKDRNSSAESKK